MPSTPRQRVLAALAHKQPDAVPYQISMTIPARAKAVEFYAARGIDDLDAYIGHHIASYEPEPPDAWVEVRPDHWRDQFGVLWNREIDKDIGNPENQLVSPENLDAFELPDPHDPRRWAGWGAFVAAHPDRFRRVAVGFSLFERAWTLRGMENLLTDFALDEDFVDALFDKLTDWLLAIVAETLKREGCDCIHFGDDWGSQHGLIMGPAYWRRYLKPRLAKVYGRVREAGLFVSIHYCGDVKEVFGDLIEIGLQMFNPFQPEVMDVAEMKRLHGEKLTFHGGISTQQTLPYSSADEVAAEVKWLCETIGKDGGYVCSPAHDIPGDVPAENIAAVIETLRGQAGLGQ